jgi:hypothetical protein
MTSLTARYRYFRFGQSAKKVTRFGFWRLLALVTDFGVFGHKRNVFCQPVCCQNKTLKIVCVVVFFTFFVQIIHHGQGLLLRSLQKQHQERSYNEISSISEAQSQS